MTRILSVSYWIFGFCGGSVRVGSDGRVRVGFEWARLLTIRVTEDAKLELVLAALTGPAKSLTTPKSEYGCQSSPAARSTERPPHWSTLGKALGLHDALSVGGLTSIL